MDGLFDLGTMGDAREIVLGERPAFVRGTLYGSVIFLGVATAWTFVARIDVVVTAPGIVRPSGEVLAVQSPQPGVVSEVLPGIKEGAAVTSGQLLIRMDTRALELDRKNVLARIEGRRAAKQDLRRAREVELAQALLELETEKTRQSIHARNGAARVATARARLDAANARVREQDRKVLKLVKLVDAGFARQLDLDEERSALANLWAAVALAERELEEARVACEPDEALLRLAEGRVALRRKALAEVDGQVPQLDAEIAALEQDRSAIELRIRRSELRAPVPGIVTRLPFTHEGRVVPEGAVVVEIAPAGSPLVLEAAVRDADRGRPLVGKPVKIRFRAYRHQEYGTVTGKVLTVSPDARSGPDRSEATYRTTIELPEGKVMDDRRGHRGSIELGMTAEADIVIEHRPLAACLVSELEGLFKN